jgi:hypothetical protein
MHDTATRSSLPRNLGAFALTLAAYASAVSTAQAQTGDSVIQGRVTTADTQSIVPEAIVTVRSPALQGEQTVVTDSTGFYRVPNLPPGTYVVRVDKEDHSSFEQPGIVLRSSTTLRVDGVLVPATTKAEEIYLTADAPTVDVGSSSVSTNISNEMVKRVPISRPGTKGGSARSFESVAQAAPEARADLYGTSMSGATSPENRYIIDGMAVNNTAYGIGSTPLSAEFIHEVNVVTGGYLPEYGRSTGGVLNVITKSGANQFSSNLWSNITPGVLEGSRKFLPREGSTLTWDQPKIGMIWDVGADVGGAIIKDKLWYYVGADFGMTSYDIKSGLYETQLDAAGMPMKEMRDGQSFTVRNLIPGTTQKYDSEATAAQFIGKLNLAASKNHALALNVIYAPYRSGSAGGFGIDAQDGRPDPLVTAIGDYNSIAYRYTNDALDSVLKWTASSSGRRVVLDTTLGWHHEIHDELPTDGSQLGDTSGLASIPGVRWRRSGTAGVHPITDFARPGSDIEIPAGYCQAPSAARCPVTAWASDSVGFMRETALDRFQLRSVLTWVAEALGHHVVKVGVDGELTTYDLQKGYAGAMLYRESPDGLTFTQFRSYGYLTGPDQAVVLPVLATNTSAFSIGGFVQDSWSVMDKVTVNAGIRYDAQYLYNTVDKLGLALPNQWSPRLGFIFDPTQAGRSRIFGSYARYFQSVPLDMADRALSGEPDTQATREAAKCNPRDPTQAKIGGACLDPANLVAEQTPDNPNQKYDLHAGTTPIDPDLKPSSVDELVLGVEYEVIKSRLGLTYTRRRLNDVIEDMSRDEATTYFIGNPGKGIAKDFPEARRDYDAFTAHFSRSFQDHWLAQASYTLSWLEGNYSGLFRPETGQLDPNITADFDLQSLLANRDGPLPGDRRHQFKLFGAKDWVFRSNHALLTGVGGRATSGAPTNVLGSHVLYGPNEVFILERGAGGRLPWSYSVDLRAGYTFLFSKDINLSLVADVFNLINFQATQTVDQAYTTSDILPIPGGKTQQDIEDYAITSRGARYNPASNNANFGKPQTTQDPRIFQFSLRASF